MPQPLDSENKVLAFGAFLKGLKTSVNKRTQLSRRSDVVKNLYLGT